jgi:hypothetical protein
MKISEHPFSYDNDDVKIAIQAATQMAERFGQDMVVQKDLSVTTLYAAEEPPLEIIRCPASMKKNRKSKTMRW